MHANTKGLLVPLGDWIELGKCQEADLDDVKGLFFGGDDEQKIAVRTYCNSCLVREECLETAVLNKEIHGVWGGTTEEERAKLIKEMKKNRRMSA